MREIEIKYHYKETEKDKSLQKCIELEFEKTKEVTEKDIYYTPAGRNLLEEGTAFRVRQIIETQNGSSKWEMTYKGPNLTLGGQDREELEIYIQSNGELLPKVLEYTGFAVLAKVHKKRIYFSLENTTICIDCVENLGEFLEIEIIGTSEAGDKAYSMIHQLLDRFDLSTAKFEPRTYLEMLLEHERAISQDIVSN